MFMFSWIGCNTREYWFAAVYYFQVFECKENALQLSCYTWDSNASSFRSLMHARSDATLPTFQRKPSIQRSCTSKKTTLSSYENALLQGHPFYSRTGMNCKCQFIHMSRTSDSQAATNSLIPSFDCIAKF